MTMYDLCLYIRADCYAMADELGVVAGHVLH